VAPALSWDLNPVVYAIWNERVSHGKKSDTADQLKQASAAHYDSASPITASVKRDIVFSVSRIRIADTLNVVSLTTL